MSKPELPAPMLPPSCDLQKFPDMPLDVNRVRKSETRVRTKAEGFRAAFMLWCAAWHQVPAGSLPADDIGLADLAGYGVAVKEWRKVRSDALRGFVLCSDGRLYHPVIVQKAIVAWRSLLERRHLTECGRMKKDFQRRGVPEQERIYPTFDLWIVTNVPDAAPYMSLGMAAIVPRDIPPMSPEPEPDVPRKKPSNRSDQNIKDLSSDRFPGGSSITDPPAPAKAAGPDQPQNPDAVARIVAELQRAKVVGATPENPVMLRLVRDGATPSQFASACAIARGKGGKPMSEDMPIGYLVPIVERLMGEDEALRSSAQRKVDDTAKRAAERREYLASASTMPENFPGRAIIRKAGNA